MKKIKSSTSRAGQKGVVLLEALIAILLISIALIGLMSLQANMVRATDESRSRAEAAYAVQQRVAEIWAAPIGTPFPDETIPGMPDGKLKTVANCGANCWTVTATWKAPGQTDTHNVTFIAIR